MLSQMQHTVKSSEAIIRVSVELMSDVPEIVCVSTIKFHGGDIDIFRNVGHQRHIDMDGRMKIFHCMVNVVP
jgi:hypothetical protein